MICRKIKRLLNAYLDKELNPQKTSLVESHLKTCLNCQKELKDFLSLKKLIGLEEKKKAPPGFSQLLLEKIREKRPLSLEIENLAKKLIPIPLALGLLLGSYLGFLNINKAEPIEEYLLSALQEREIIALEGFYYEIFF